MFEDPSTPETPLVSQQHTQPLVDEVVTLMQYSSSVS
jgi:hypothetical protein